MIDIIDVSNPAAPKRPTAPNDVLNLVAACESVLGKDACPIEAGNEPNAVVISGNLLAVAVGNPIRTNNGHAMFFALQGASLLVFLAAVEVGALPDMITFTEDGRHALTANEGEPNADYTTDPRDHPAQVCVRDVSA